MKEKLLNRLRQLFRPEQFKFKKIEFKNFYSEIPKVSYSFLNKFHLKPAKLFFSSVRQKTLKDKNFKQFIFSQFKVKQLIILSGVVLLIVISLLTNVYKKIYHPNVIKTFTVYIPTGSDYPMVLSLLKDNGLVKNLKSFNWVARRKMYPFLIKPGAYKIEKGWDNNQLVDKLRSGDQTPINVTFNNIRFRENLAGVLSHYLEPDSVSFLSALNNDSLAINYGFTHKTFPCIFIPNTYEFYWTTTPLKFVARMKREYDIFWNESRRSKAGLLGLSPTEVTILASIVQEETNKNDEKPRIAGVYMNRLHRGWLLQADPTIKYAMHDFSVRRILDDYLKIDSHYNTYKYPGLPPGPINLPEISSIDAVLNAETNDYMYFCAKDDFSGYHNFAKTLYEHNLNAAKYQRALNRMNILK